MPDHNALSCRNRSILCIPLDSILVNCMYHPRRCRKEHLEHFSCKSMSRLVDRKYRMLFPLWYSGMVHSVGNYGNQADTYRMSDLRCLYGNYEKNKIKIKIFKFFEFSFYFPNCSTYLQVPLFKSHCRSPRSTPSALQLHNSQPII